MNFFGVSGLLSGIASVAVGLFVYLNNPRSMVAKMWVGITAVIAVWEFGVWRIAAADSVPEALIYWKLAHVGVIFIPIVFLHFVYTFLKKQKKFLLIIVYLFGLYFIYANFSGQLISHVEWVFNEFYYDGRPPTFLYILFLIFWLTVTVYAHSLLISALKQETGVRKNQIKYFFIGTAVSFSGGILAFLPVFGINLYPYGNIMVLFYPFIMTYAIVRYRLMGVTVILRKSMIYSLLLSAILTTYGVIIFTAQKFFIYAPNYSDFGAVLLASFLVVIGQKPLRTVIARFTDKIFFKAGNDYNAVIKITAAAINEARDINHLGKIISAIVLEWLKVERAFLLVWNNEYNCFVNVSPGQSGQEQVRPDNQLISFFQRQGESVALEELNCLSSNDVQHSEKINNMILQMQLLGVALVVPIILKERLVGIIGVGTKLSQDMFFEEDIQMFKNLSNQIALAIENIKLINEEKNIARRVAALRERDKYIGILEKKNRELEAAYNELKATQIHLVQSEKMALIGTLAGGVAHEINTPLGTILLNSELMINQEIIPEAKQNLEFIRHGVIKCKSVVAQLLQYSRQAALEFSQVNIKDIIDGVCLLLERQFVDAGIIIEKKYAQLPLINGSYNELAQVVTNLMVNAGEAIKRKFPHKENEGVIKLIAEIKENKVMISIIDNGCGISEEDSCRVFDPFFTTKGQEHSSGLGLFVAQAIIARHQGQIKIYSLREQGTTFVIELPI